MHVFGTAGHVDHGKSTLIAALTGTHPDRLREEKEREMTINLGFAWMKLPSGEEIGFVDVPGHRDFIENMLAGVGGIDACLLIIAADEGIMPQTKEHLAILDLLGVTNGIVCLTKIDMISEPEWLDLMEMEVREFLAGTGLSQAPVVRVSAREGTGVEALKVEISKLLQTLPATANHSKPRLPIDRVFSIAGFGTVVTGTLLDGDLQIGNEVEILPSGKRGRIRGLQTHKKKEQTADVGSRTAVNITGVDVDEIQRGNVLSYPGMYQPVTRFDSTISVLRDVNRSLRHNELIKLFVGAAEIQAHCRVLEGSEILPGAEKFVQVECLQPVVLVERDRFIIRRMSPAETITGGIVLSTRENKRRKLNDGEVLRELENLRKGNELEVVVQSVVKDAGTEAQIASRLRTVNPDLNRLILAAVDQNLLDQYIESGKEAMYLASSSVQRLFNSADRVMREFHAANPLKAGLTGEALRTKSRLSDTEFKFVVQRGIDTGAWKQDNKILSLFNHQPALSKAQEAAKETLLQKFSQNPFTPPDLSEAKQVADDDVIDYLLSAGILKRISDEILLSANAYEQLKQKLASVLSSQGKITVSEFRELVGTTRKYAVPILEHFDAVKFTKREGDYRVLYMQ